MGKARVAISALRQLSWCGDMAMAAKARAAIRIINGVPIDFVAEALRVDLWAMFDSEIYFRPVVMPEVRSKRNV